MVGGVLSCVSEKCTLSQDSLPLSCTLSLQLLLCFNNSTLLPPVSSLVHKTTVLFIFLDIQQAGNYFHGVDNSPSPPDFGLLCDRNRKIWTKRSMSAFIPFRGRKKKSSGLLRIPPPEVQMYYWWLEYQIGIMSKLVLRIWMRIWIWIRIQQFSTVRVISCPNVLLMVGKPNWYYNFKGRVGKP